MEIDLSKVSRVMQCWGPGKARLPIPAPSSPEPQYFLPAEHWAHTDQVTRGLF